MHQDEVHDEALPTDAKELVDFLQELADQQAKLADSDQGSVRVLDDLIEVMIQKNLLALEDLPEVAKQKVLDRQSLRGADERK